MYIKSTPDVSIAPARVFLQFALQGSPVHVQSPGGGGYIALMLIEYPLNVLPLHFFHRRWFRAKLGSSCQSIKTADELIHGNRLAQIVDCPAAHGLNCCGNAAITREYENIQIRLSAEQLGQKLQAAFAGKVQIEHAPMETLCAQRAKRFSMRLGLGGFDTLALEGALKYLQKGSVIVNKQPVISGCHVLLQVSRLDGPAWGISMIMVVPCWSTRAFSVPPRRWMVALVRKRPTPMPFSEPTICSPRLFWKASSSPSP